MPRSSGYIRGVAVLVALALSVGPGCSPDGSNNPAEATSASCVESPQVPPDHALRADAKGGEVWALPIGPFPAQSGELLKIVWRVTGSGDPSVTAVAPDGSSHPPVNGPIAHASSNFDRPGEEWGTFFEFPEPGCWRLFVRRGEVEGVVRIWVE